MSTPKDCPNFNNCDAPLCPLDEDLSHRNYIYDPPYVEDVCPLLLQELSSEVELQHPEFREKIQDTKPTMIFKIGPYLEKAVEDYNHKIRVYLERKERARQLAERRNQ